MILSAVRKTYDQVNFSLQFRNFTIILRLNLFLILSLKLNFPYGFNLCKLVQHNLLIFNQADFK